MKNVVAGTAGHIDHGKTALVKALTGIDADRLAEEKRRGITIDLGFAHLELTPDLRMAFVDVPGHERFIKNMLAGVGGIDMALFCVAADESIKPQTREHFDICRLLGIPRGVIALTKADLVDEDILGLVRLEVEEFVAGSFLEAAPIVAVSAVTGAGLSELRAALVRVAEAVPERNVAGYFRLPIDRAFSVKGFGAVVTGTLISGSLAREQEVEVYPSGRRSRVRGIETHGAPDGARRRGPAHRSEPAGPGGDRCRARRRAVRAWTVPRGTRNRLPAGPVAIGQAAETPRAGSLPFGNGGDRGSRDAAGTLRRRRASAGRKRLGADRAARARAAAAG